MLSADEKSEVWNGVWNGHWYSNPALRKRRAEQKLDAIATWLQGTLANAKVCDLGCGTGYFLEELVRRYPEISEAHGVDHSVAAIQAALARLRNDQFRFQPSGSGPLPYPTNYFDVVFAVCVFEHVDALHEAIKESARILRKTGLLIVVYSNTLSAFYLERIIKSSFSPWPFGHQKELSPISVRTVFSPHFDCRESLSIHGDRDFPILTSLIYSPYLT